MDVRDLRNGLRKLDAYEDRGSHHIYFYLEVHGVDHRVGKLSHSMRGELPDFVVRDTGKRLKLISQEFNALVDCRMGKTQFMTLWDLRP